ncbi:MAG: HAMP domain-containing histidine kinase, partial [Candidatus Diapherotrites archaeon]|nr:HAMP domain-containing histidine kinase [Candidatus Diapherotrites archaeon]
LKDEFISVSSHELKTPLTSIRGYSELLQSSSSKKLSSKEKTRILGVIVRNVDRLTLLVNDILDVSRLQSGTFKLNLTRLNITKVLDDLVESLTPSFKQKGITITKNYSRGLPLVYADVDRITQVVNNLLGNSLKFTPSKGKVEVSAFKDKGNIVISVKDSGIGVDKKHANKIFEKFYQEEPAATHSLPGTGLGLSICKGIIKAHKGKLWAESKGKGKGLTVFFSLPKGKR